jgi:hypothetical protein
MYASDALQELITLALQEWASHIVKRHNKNVRLHPPSGVTSRDRTRWCPIHQLCFSIFLRSLRQVGDVSSNSIHTCDYGDQTSSLIRREFTYFLFSLQAYYFAAFMLHNGCAGFTGDEQSLWM